MSSALSQTPSKSHWCCPPFYVYTREDAKKVKEAIAQKECGTDAPGSFIAWLCTVTDVHAMEMPGKRYDIGNLESYQKVQQEYQGIGNPLSAFRHKQASTLVAEQTTISSIYRFLRVNI